MLALILVAALGAVLWSQFVYLEAGYKPAQDTSASFRTALSLSPFSLPQFEQGYTFRIGDKTASTPEELQAIYRELGSTEMIETIYQTIKRR